MAGRISQEVLEIALEGASSSRISQQVLEVMLCPPTAANARISQIVLEVMLCAAPEAPLSLACPVGGDTAAVGVPYDEFLIAGGGTPPYTFEIIP